MKGITAILIVALLALGCATTRPEEVAGMDLTEQLEAYIDEYLQEVQGLCLVIQEKAKTGQSPMDCAYSENLHRLYLSFPNGDYVSANRDDILRLTSHWCAAAQAKIREPSAWVGYLRQEKASQVIACPYGDEVDRETDEEAS